MRLPGMLKLRATAKDLQAMGSTIPVMICGARIWRETSCLNEHPAEANTKCAGTSCLNEHPAEANTKCAGTSYIVRKQTTAETVPRRSS